MWIIVQSDTEDDRVNVLMDEDGCAMQFKNKISAYRYLEKMCNDSGVDHELLENDIELWRMH